MISGVAKAVRIAVFPARQGESLFSTFFSKYVNSGVLYEVSGKQQMPPERHSVNKRFGGIGAWICEHSSDGGALSEPVRVSFAPPSVIGGAAKPLRSPCLRAWLRFDSYPVILNSDLLGKQHIQLYPQLNIQPGLSVVQRDLGDLADPVHAVEHGLIMNKQLFGGLA